MDAMVDTLLPLGTIGAQLDFVLETSMEITLGVNHIAYPLAATTNQANIQTVQPLNTQPLHVPKLAIVHMEKFTQVT